MTLEDRVARIEALLGLAEAVSAAPLSDKELAAITDPAVHDLEQANTLRASARQILTTAQEIANG